jgi:hypothetical protein
MKPVSLADISYDQGLKLLQLRKQALDAGHIVRLPAAALANSSPMTGSALSFKAAAAGSWLDTARQYLSQGAANVGNAWTQGADSVNKAWRDTPTREAILYGLGGAGLGAAGAGGLAAMRGDKDWKQRSLQGALAGGILGGGLGLVKNPQMLTKHVEPALQGAAESAITPVTETAKQKETKNLDRLVSNAGTPLAATLGTPAATTGIGGAAALATSSALKKLPGAGVDRQFIAQELLSNFDSDPKLQARIAKDYPHILKAPAGNNPYAALFNVNQAPSELKDDALKLLTRALPNSNIKDVAGLSGFLSDPAAAARLAEQSKHFDLFTRAAQQPGILGLLKNLRAQSVLRKIPGVGLPIAGAAYGGNAALSEMRKILSDRKMLASLQEQAKPSTGNTGNAAAASSSSPGNLDLIKLLLSGN